MMTELHDTCVGLVRQMFSAGILRHVSYVTCEDLPELISFDGLAYRVEVRFAEEDEMVADD